MCSWAVNIRGETQPPVEDRPDWYDIRNNAGGGHLDDLARTHLGLCLLHDVGQVTGWLDSPHKWPVLGKLDDGQPGAAPAAAIQLCRPGA